MPKTTQLVLSLQSKRGVLAGIGRALAEAKVNILSLSAAEAAGRGKIRMVVNKPTLAKRAVRQAAQQQARSAGACRRQARARRRQHQNGLRHDGGPRRRDRDHHGLESGQGAPDHRLDTSGGGPRRPPPSLPLELRGQRPRSNGANPAARRSAERAKESADVGGEGFGLLEGREVP